MVHPDLDSGRINFPGTFGTNGALADNPERRQVEYAPTLNIHTFFIILEASARRLGMVQEYCSVVLWVNTSSWVMYCS